MRELVRKEMEAGALGIGTSLIYPPAFYAKTEELIELCKVAAKYQGKYVSHMRSEGNQLLEGVDELLRISREAGIPAEVYHIKAAGEKNWPKEDQLLGRIEAAHRQIACGSSKNAWERPRRNNHGRVVEQHPHDDLISEDESRIDTIYFLMSEENVKKELAKPWISFGSDEASQAAEGIFLKWNPHPRAYGNFARVLGKYVRDEKVITLPEAVRRLSALPATNLGLDHRGFIQDGMFADVVVFDPAKIADRATFDKPHQYAVGMKHVFVNGVQVLKDGEHTGAKPGRALAGPGKLQ